MNDKSLVEKKMQQLSCFDTRREREQREVGEGGGKKKMPESALTIERR